LRRSSSPPDCRLARALAERLGEQVLTIEGRCVSYGGGSPLRPLKQAFAEVAGVLPEDTREAAREKLRALIPQTARRSEIEQLLHAFGLSGRAGEAVDAQRAARILLAELATDQPVLFILDDLHCAKDARELIGRY